MQAHPLAEALQNLRESSKHAIAEGNSYNFDEFSEYFHVEREIEQKLVDRIRFCSQRYEPSLLLVCGNVGDGKSHILSYLNKVVPEEIKRFKIHNDATEAHDPNGNSNDTLNRVLESFQDQNIENSKDRLILAINLGTLNNFIDTHGDKYSKLIEYVNKKKILDTDLIDEDSIDEESIFQHVNFTDYHMYSLSEYGAESKIISTLLERLTKEDEQNPVYRAYIEFQNMSFSVDCPISFNYQFISKKKYRDVISDFIIQSIIKNKEIVSIRSLMNFFYDLIVPIGLKWENLKDYEVQLNKMSVTDYLSNTTPNYLFEHSELSSLFEKFQELDPCAYRYSELDQNLIQLINSNRPESIFTRFINGDSTEGLIGYINHDKLNKNNLTKLFIRLNYFNKSSEVLERSNPYFMKFMQLLYLFNCNDESAKKKVYNLVYNSARLWYGDPKKSGKAIVKLGRNQSKYRIFKDFKPSPILGNGTKKNDPILTRFVQEFTLFFENGNSEKLKIHVDYSLFELLNKIVKGYRPNRKDNNNYITFITFINRLINHENDKSALEIDEINIGKAADYKLSLNYLGEYTFDTI
ncbi:DNA phosphorothioation-dependent restriction protein DptF [Salegentibacter sp. LM13S]|uniref:DNA phosphorothioation-dependent restriction protein DptF n=1 Tax=Salegentibacter lacus TaxID=2873599 RepID=UPI001CC9418A|nr:DNA phosphorothioation-dependent restriction protein DptF [Salegentibacter lacus]MBZ9631389.1 DNA phosphorothioation-dependent restriction protein DptF [Salegentibacter lacus]